MSAQTGAEQKIPGWKRWYRWWAIMPTVVINCWGGYGMFYTSSGPFVMEWVKRFGVTRAVATTPYSVGNLFQVFGPLLGGFMDRYGQRKAYIVSLIAMMIGTLLLAFVSQDTFWLAIVGYILLCAFGLTIPTYPGATKTINFWFLKRRSFAVGINTLITGTVYFSAAFQGAFIIAYGLAGGAFYLFGLGVIMLLLSIFVLRDKASDMGVGLDGAPLPAKGTATDGGQKEPVRLATRKDKVVAQLTVPQVLRTRALWLVSLSSGFVVMIANAYIVGNYIPFLRGLGMDPVAAGVIWGFMGFCGWPARFIWGWLIDYFGRGTEQWLVVLDCVLLGLGCLGLFFVKGTQDIFWVWWWTVLWGLGWGGNMTAIFSLVGTYFGPAPYGSTYGIRCVFIGIAGFIGPIMGGWIFDITGSYANAFLVSIVLCFIGAILMVFCTPPRIGTDGKLMVKAKA